MSERIYPGATLRQPFDAEITRCEKLLSENPENIDALNSLAQMYITLWCYGFIPHAEAIPKAQDVIERALKIDEKSGLAHVNLGLIKESYWQWDELEREYQLGIEYAPEDAAAYNWYANYLYATNRIAEAYKMAEKAVEFSDDPGYRIGLAAVSYFAQDNQRLKREMLDLIEEHPDYAPAYDWLGMAYVQMEDFDNSIEVYEKAATLSGRLGEILGGLGHAYGMAGNEKETRRILDEMNEYDRYTHMPPVQIAFVYASLGDVENTVRMLERAYQERSWELIFMRTEPWLEPFHDEPRFRDIIKRMKFPTL